LWLVYVGVVGSVETTWSRVAEGPRLTYRKNDKELAF
jgi:hypothetical protein